MRIRIAQMMANTMHTVMSPTSTGMLCDGPSEVHGGDGEIRGIYLQSNRCCSRGACWLV